MRFLAIASLLVLPLSGLAALDCSKYSNPQLKQSCTTLQQTTNSALQNNQKVFEKDYSEQQTIVENEIKSAEITPAEEAKMPLIPPSNTTPSTPMAPATALPGSQQSQPIPAPVEAQPVQPLAPSVSPYQPPELPPPPSGKPRRYY